MLDYMILAFFAAYLGLKFAQTRATGHLWFLLPLLLVVGLHQGWANHYGEAFFVGYRVVLLASCGLAAYMYYRDYHKRNAEAIVENAKKRKQAETKRQQQNLQASADKNNNNNNNNNGKNHKKKK